MCLNQNLSKVLTLMHDYGLRCSGNCMVAWNSNPNKIDLLKNLKYSLNDIPQYKST